MNSEPELVVLLSEDGNPIGTCDKKDVHTNSTALHLAFSCHIFNEAGEVLVTRRALTKVAWPGVWTNSACGHPAPDESFEDAIRRRVRHELNIEVRDIRELIPDFRYRATDASGIEENEICPVFTAVTDETPNPNPDEVSEFAWVAPERLIDASRATPFGFSPWLCWQIDRVIERDLAYRAL